MDNLETGQRLVLDARSLNASPAMRRNRARACVRGTFRAHATSFADVLDGRSAHFRMMRNWGRSFSALDASPDADVTVSCGSGVTACTLALASLRPGGRKRRSMTDRGANGAMNS